MIHQTGAIQLAKATVGSKFPEFIGKRISYSFVSGKKCDYYIAVRKKYGKYQVYIEGEALQLSPMAFTGCFAQELAHVIIECRKPVFQKLFGGLSKKKNETPEEKSADMLAIERGFGGALLQFYKEQAK